MPSGADAGVASRPSDTPVKLWRSTPFIPTHSGAAPAPRPAQEAVLTSARQGLTEALTCLGLGRADYIGIPDYAGHCVIDFVGRIATPVPLRFLPPDRAAAVLIYDQWGWQKSRAARIEVNTHCAGAKVLWDRIDSLPRSFEVAARADESEADVQVFSLSKTLGAGGGGLVWICGSGWLRRSANVDTAFVDALERLRQGMAGQARTQELVDRLFRNECGGHPPRLRQWLEVVDVDEAASLEHQLRRERLQRCLMRLGTDALPEWMRVQAEDDWMASPGIFPLRLRREEEAIVSHIAKTFGIEAPLYHFNVRDSYLHPEWIRVAAIPLHSELEVGRLEALLDYVCAEVGVDATYSPV